ncbi:hypothetical protein JW960_10230 [candidate division KSB1 bacterium]|nr:hypothetical protein [candidate division KSB1 bacterium]
MSDHIPLISKSVRDQAKAFLCWDYDKNLTIQLIPLHSEVAYFFPPARDLSTIFIFYPAHCTNFLNSICYMFHEVGHFEQFKKRKASSTKNSFIDEIQFDKGEQRLAFETEAWDLGAGILKIFLKTIDVDEKLILKHYIQLQTHSLQSYTE